MRIDDAFIYGSWADPAYKSPSERDVFVVGHPDIGAVYDAVCPAEAQVGRPVNVTVRSPPNGKKPTRYSKRPSKQAQLRLPMSILNNLRRED